MPNGWSLDWQTPTAPIVTDEAFELGIMGIMFDGSEGGYGEDEWSVSFPDMPYDDTTEAAQFQAYVSDLSVNSLLGSWLEVGNIAGWVHGDQLPGPAANSTITASEINLILPGFSDYYGKDTIVDIYLNTTDLSRFASSAANQDITLYGSVDIQFWPRLNGTTELAVDLSV